MLFPPGADVIEGNQAIASFWKSAIESGITEVTLESVAVEDGGKVVIEVGRYVLISGNKPADNGKYIVVWRLEDGAWKLYRDIWNSSRQQPSTA